MLIGLQCCGFVIVWQSWQQQGDKYDGYFQRLDLEGAKLGTEADVNGKLDGSQNLFDLAEDEEGGWLVVWQGAEPNSSVYSVFARRFDSQGKPLYY